jgi:hypothetical protein
MTSAARARLVGLSLMCGLMCGATVLGDASTHIDGAEQSSDASRILGTPSPTVLLPADRVVPGRYVDVALSACPPVVGTRPQCTLTALITPKPGHRVYAPGNAGYTPVTLSVTSRPTLTVGQAAYPPSEMYFFAPLNERVKIYQSPFRLSTVVTILGPRAVEQASAGGSTLTIAGTLDYQACDDRVCYLPQTLPLTWTVALAPSTTP